MIVMHRCWGPSHGRLEEQELLSAFLTLETPLVMVLAAMDAYGLAFDATVCAQYQAAIEARLEALQQQAYDLAGRPFALSNPRDVAHILYDVLGLQAEPSAAPARRLLGPSGRRAVSSRPAAATSKAVLTRLADQHALPGVVLEWRSLSKMLVSVIFQLRKICRPGPGPGLDPNNLRLYASSNTHTATGRIAVREPNLQNLPKVFELPCPDGVVRVVLRNTVVAGPGCVLVSADYCQLEMRILAHLSGDPGLLHVLRGADDVFTTITSEWLGVPASAITPGQRQATKAVCYGIVYGMGPATMARGSGCSASAATAAIASFKRKFAGLAAYLQATVVDCRRLGYVCTLAGRRRWLPDINSRDAARSSAAERRAVNTTVQVTVAAHAMTSHHIPPSPGNSESINPSHSIA